MMITIGAVIDVFGIRGELKIKPLVDDELIFKQIKTVMLVGKNGKSAEKEIVSAKKHNEVWLIKLSGIETPEEGVLLKGSVLQADKSALTPAGKDEVYWLDIEGAKVIDTEGKPVGTLTGYIETGTHDVFEIEGIDGVEYLISNNPAHVVAIDVKEKTVTIDRIGLVD